MTESSGTQPCPHCAEAIRADAILCRFCKRGISLIHFRPCTACGEMIRIEAMLCRYCKTQNEPIESASNMLTADEHLKNALELQCGVNYVNLRKVHVPAKYLKLLPESLIRQYKCIAIDKHHNRIVVAMVTPNNLLALDALKKELNSQIKPVVCTEQDFDGFMTFTYAKFLLEKSSTVAAIRTQADETPIVLLANTILNAGIKSGAANIYLEPESDAFAVFNVVDGRKTLTRRLPESIAPALMARFKVMAGIEIDSENGEEGQLTIQASRKDYKVTIAVQDGNSMFLRIEDA